MSKIMVINVTHAEESRVGIIADGVLTSFEIESFSREHLKGNIYKAVVHRVQPGLEAAFVDIGAERDAFLPLDEICFRNLKDAARPSNGNGGEGRRRVRITEVLKPGEEVLVQIVKEAFGNKPPTLSTFFSLAGRYLVLLPGSEDAGISRRIEGPDRVRIRELIEKLEPPSGFGIIVRTVAGFDQGERELQRDLTYLLRLWDSIQQAAAAKRAPALIYREHDLVLRNIRDYFTPDIDEVHIDNEEVFERARAFFREVMPDQEGVLRLYGGEQPIFSHFNVESQIESVYKRRVALKSGGSIVIDGTEALTAIDVNSGRSTRGASQEDTAVRTNLEAAAEIARQLRLRDLGGLIVIDFIDMRSPQHVAEVERALRTAMHEDKARHEIGRISQFGLLEISRQRLRPAAAATSYVACPMCDGHGLVRTTESAALVALRKIHHRVSQGDASAIRVSLPPPVAVYLLNQKREDLAQLERRYATRIQVLLNEALMPHQSEFEVRPRIEGREEAAVPKLRLGGVAVVAAPEPAESSDIPAASGNGGGETADSVAETAPTKRKRRRGRKRGRGMAAAVAIGDALRAVGAHLGAVEGERAGDRDETVALADPRKSASGAAVGLDESATPALEVSAVRAAADAAAGAPSATAVEAAGPPPAGESAGPSATESTQAAAGQEPVRRGARARRPRAAGGARKTAAARRSRTTKASSGPADAAAGTSGRPRPQRGRGRASAGTAAKKGTGRRKRRGSGEESPVGEAPPLPAD
jgi:ribonuclease E